MTEDRLPEESPAQRLGRIIRQGRGDKNWSQEELATRAEVSVPTVKRYESGKTATPEPDAARRVFLTLGLDPRWLPVVLGYVTADEMELPASAPPRVFSTTIDEAIRILEDPSIPASAKEEWVQFLRFRASTQAPEQPKHAS
jgi:transcriptional regulator with XRE-family HTH domain